MSLVYITRKEHFNAAHKLANPKWSDEKNSEVFGPCANPNFHGHNFELYVTVKGEPDPETGFIMDLKKLRDIIKVHVVDLLDHQNINLDVDFMKGKMASIENIAIGIWNQISPHLVGCELHRIKLVETRHNYVEYFGE